MRSQGVAATSSRLLRSDYFAPQVMASTNSPMSSTRLYVGNLSTSVDEYALLLSCRRKAARLTPRAQVLVDASVQQTRQNLKVGLFIPQDWSTKRETTWLRFRRILYCTGSSLPPRSLAGKLTPPPTLLHCCPLLRRQEAQRAMLALNDKLVRGRKIMVTAAAEQVRASFLPLPPSLCSPADTADDGGDRPKPTPRTFV